ncbi:MAG: PEP-utilizing enzyme [Syntrophales bacterium]|nr:PEP-utilizing enzyme [Syntrophales bacterium]
MTLTLSLDRVEPRDRGRVGGKGYALSRMARHGLPVPGALLVTVEAYRRYIDRTGIGEAIALEINRKIADEMRWEELWDAALRIRTLFLRTPLPGDIRDGLARDVEARFRDVAVVVRSSAPGEDSAKASFAGLHESFVNVRGTESILDHIRLVWASLWSDAALLYRKELALDIATSAMAVVVQEIVAGDRSGVAFSMSPDDPSRSVIEAVHGLNQGLVDGTVEPDRWILDRKTGRLLSHRPAGREKALYASEAGVEVRPLGPGLAERPPLAPQEVALVFRTALEVETFFGSPQDVEWTIRNGALHILQARPVTAAEPAAGGDKRPWYLTLRRSFENLKGLRLEVEGRWIPAMIADAAALSGVDLAALSDEALAAEIDRRQSLHGKWTDIYIEFFIPLAHGIRLFGQTYNDALRPADPYEFMDLLGGTGMISLERNRLLERMAGRIRGNPRLAEALRQGTPAGLDAAFDADFEAFSRNFGDLGCGTDRCFTGQAALAGLLLRMAEAPPAKERFDAGTIDRRRDAFLSRFAGDARTRAAEILDLGRASYRLRDNDNIHLGKIEGALLAAVGEATLRLARRPGFAAAGLAADQAARALRDPGWRPQEEAPGERSEGSGSCLRARQLRGQPAGPGVARGPARVIASPEDLLEIRAGEILVCDAIDPNMTFAVPLAAGIVERRGGMLIHGAIIAREYGIPCVTGIPGAAELIRTGDRVSVDGWLGIVTIEARLPFERKMDYIESKGVAD